MAVKFKNDSKVDIVSEVLKGIGVADGTVKAGKEVEVNDRFAFAVGLAGLPLVEVVPGSVAKVEAEKAAAEAILKG